MALANIYDLDGKLITVEDFDIIVTRGLEVKQKICETDEVLRPDIMAEKIHGNSRADNLLIFKNNKCLFDIEEGENINYFEL